jgi:hypothetical protein
MEGNGMGKKVSQRTRQELITAVVARYARSGRDDKTRILDEFARITGYHRKHAIRLLSRHQEPTCDRGHPSPNFPQPRAVKSGVGIGIRAEKLVEHKSYCR